MCWIIAFPPPFYEAQTTYSVSSRASLQTHERKRFYTERDEMWGVGVRHKNSFITPGEGVNEGFK